MTEPTPTPNAAPTLPLFYKSLVALDRNVHTRLKVRPPEDFLFTAEANLIPLLTGEFAPVAREYPIAFMRDPGADIVVPVALTGLPQSKNVFVNAAGKWDARYIPAYVRRYPFVFVETGPDNFTVCIDPNSKCFDEKEGAALFGNDGQPSNVLNETIKGLQDYQALVAQTRSFAKRLGEANILMEANATADLADGRNFAWRGFWIVDEKKFRELPEATILDWFKTGELGLIYAHLVSLGNLGDILRRQSLSGAPLGAAQGLKSQAANS